MSKPESKPAPFGEQPQAGDEYEVIGHLHCGVIVRYLTGPWKDRTSTIRNEQRGKQSRV